MGTCAAQCCSSEALREMRMETYMNPEKRKKQPIADESSSYITALTAPIVPITLSTDIPDAPRRLSIEQMDSKTIQLLSGLELFGPSPVAVPQDPAPSDMSLLEEPQPSETATPQPAETSTPQPAEVPQPAEAPPPADAAPSVKLLEEDESFELHEIEKNVSSTRIEALEDVANKEELEALMHQQYVHDIASIEDDDDADDDEDEEEEESSLDEAEIAEIQRRKSNQNLQRKGSNPSPNSVQANKPAIYRDTTCSTWEASDLDELHNDMEQHLATLVSLHKTSDMELPNFTMDIVAEKEAPAEAEANWIAEDEDTELEISDDSDEFEEEPEKKTPVHAENKSLFRNKSAYKWDKDTMDERQNEMKKAMMHMLMDKQRTSTKSNISSHQ